MCARIRWELPPQLTEAGLAVSLLAATALSTEMACGRWSIPSL